MRIGIDARLLSYRRGMGNFVYNLLREFAELAKSHQFFLYVDHPGAVLSLPAVPNFTMRVLGPKPYALWEQLSLPLAVARDRLDILHCPANTAPLLVPSTVRLVITIHDVMYLLPAGVLPSAGSTYQRLGRLYRRLVVPLATRNAAAIITVSTHSREEISRLLNQPATRIRVINEAAGSAFRVISDRTLTVRVRTRYGLARPFVLGLAGVDPRKNTGRIIEAYALFRKQGTRGYQLVLVGLPAGRQAGFVRLARALGVADEVVITGFVPEEDLVALYNAAELLVYPSLYEGFGLPVLEAMACGTPVVTSPSGSLPEVSGEAALMVDPLNVAEIADALWRVVDDASLRQDLVARGLARAQQFSWRQAAEQTMDVYVSVVA